MGLAANTAGVSIRRPGTGPGAGPLFGTTDALLDHHFATWSTSDHINKQSMADTLRRLGGRPATIVETGSSAWGANSSQLFDSYVTSFGGTFESVDLRMGPMRELRPVVSPRTTLATGDSVRLLERWVGLHPGVKVDLVYLDSWDLDAADPVPSAVHGLKELMAIRPALRDGSLVLVDDTPSDLSLYAEAQRATATSFFTRHGALPGKGMFIGGFLAGQPGVEKLHHGYQVLYRFT